MALGEKTLLFRLIILLTELFYKIAYLNLVFDLFFEIFFRGTMKQAMPPGLSNSSAYIIKRYSYVKLFHCSAFNGF